MIIQRLHQARSRTASAARRVWRLSHREAKRGVIETPADTKANRVQDMEHRLGVRSFSQTGEDVVLRSLLKSPRMTGPGFYVDVGALHPIRFSNTYYFYQRGWRGINIDAMPGSMAAFDDLRPGDINLEIGVAEKADSLEYFIFNEPALNGFSPDLSARRDDFESFRLLETRKVAVKPLREILDGSMPEGQEIDFLTIDAEGFDLAVLRSNDWDRFRPRVVVTEELGCGIRPLMESEAVKFLEERDYSLRCRTTSSCFFVDQRPRQ